MAHVNAYLPVALRWRAAGELDFKPLCNAYCLLEMGGSGSRVVEKVVSEAAFARAKTNELRLRFLARTNDKGVLCALSSRAGAADPLELPNLRPLLLPLGSRFDLTWTDKRSALEALETAAADSFLALAPKNRIALVLDQSELPPALLDVVLDAQNAHATGEALLGPMNFPVEQLRLAEDGKTWSIELTDKYLELGIEAALGMSHVSGLRKANAIPAHQLLLKGVLEILARGGAEPSRLNPDGTQKDLVTLMRETPLVQVVQTHERVGGDDYRALFDDLNAVSARCEETAEASGRVARTQYRQALLELTLHPYPEGHSTGSRDGTQKPAKGGGIYQQKWASKVLLEHVGAHLAPKLFTTMFVDAPDDYPTGDDAKQARQDADTKTRDRLLHIAKGDFPADPQDEIEQFVAWSQAMIAKFNQASDYPKELVKLGALTDPKLAASLTGWVEVVVAIAASRQRDRRAATVGVGLTLLLNTMHALAGSPPGADVKVIQQLVSLRAREAEKQVTTSLATWASSGSARAFRTAERTAAIFKLFNALSLIESLTKPEDERPSSLQQLMDTFGVVEGCEATYRLFTSGVEGHLGIAIKELGVLLAPIDVYLSVEKTWSHVLAGNSLAAIIASAGVLLSIVTTSASLARTTLSPAFSAALLVVGVGLALGAKLAYDDDETFLENYQPGVGGGGAYAKARSAVRSVQNYLRTSDGTALVRHRCALLTDV